MIKIDKALVVLEDFHFEDLKLFISDNNGNKAELSKKDLEDLLSDIYKCAIEEAFFKNFGGKK